MAKSKKLLFKSEYITETDISDCEKNNIETYRDVISLSLLYVTIFLFYSVWASDTGKDVTHINVLEINNY